MSKNSGHDVNFYARLFLKRVILMKFMRFLGILWLLIPCVSFAAGSTDFQNATKLLTAARRGDIQTVQVLINAGVDVDYVDSTGLSLVCTAVMNNDTRAIQILEMYGADASDCDKQIKKYKQKTKVAARGEEYGFFSGLSSTQILALSAVGVAAVLGGVVLLTKVFDDDGGHGSSGTNGDRPNKNPDDSSATVSGTNLFAQNLPYGPGCIGDTCSQDYELWEQMRDFEYMSNNGFNYLMVARAYDPFVRGYLGMATVRNDTTKVIFDLSKYPFQQEVGGGKPVNVAVVTGSGVNATGSAMDGLIYWFDETQKNSLISFCNSTDGSVSAACQEAVDASVKTSHKYYNYSGATAGTSENASFDLSGSGTVFGLANADDTKFAKIIAGWEGDEVGTQDYYGFIPNGQLTVYKTGNGNAWVDPTTPVSTTYHIAGDNVAVGDTFNLFGGTLTVTEVNNGAFVATSGGDTYHGYIIGDKLFIDSNADGNTNQMYVFNGTNLDLSKELAVADYKNYAAIYDAVQLRDSGNYVSNVVANLSLPATSVALDYATVAAAKMLNDAATTDALKKSVYKGLINNYYNLNSADDGTMNQPGTDAENAFVSLGNYQQQILVNSAGHNLVGLGAGQSLAPLVATFENFAPVVYNNLQNLFMTVVAVSPADGTQNKTISQYNESGAGKIELSTWQDVNDNTINYSSRICGLTGTGNGGAMNPWCFAAPGTTDLEATAAMAGSVALVKSAFNYMTPKEIFLLLALTADGPYLGTDPTTDVGWKTKDGTDNGHDLINYLRGMYTLPGDLNTSNEQYLESFKTAFGFGLINLERATKPGTNIYYFGSDKNVIVSSDGVSYWRKAPASSSSSSSARASSVFSLTNSGAIKTSFFDVIESSDGSISLPRVWNMTLTGDNSRHGLYMGDVLGEFSVDSTNKRQSKIDNMTFEMALSPRAYNDNLNGLDDLRVNFSNEKYDVYARYQRHLTNGESRFGGRANGVLALVANSVESGAKYKIGNFAFGAHAFSGNITDENLLENDPVVSSQFEPKRLGLANGASVDTEYNNGKFGLNVSFGSMNETDTVLGMQSDGLVALNGGNTQYFDTVATYNPFDWMKITARATFANTDAKLGNGIISSLSTIKSNAFAFGFDIGGFDFTASMPLAVIDGKMGYDYADLNVVENDGKYEVVANNPHVEYLDLSAQKRELRFDTSYKHSIGEWTDAGVGFIYRVNPNNTNAFGNESIFMFKMHHRLGI